MQAIWIVLAVVVAFALASWKLLNSLITMQIRMGAGVILSRYDSPWLFWLVIALQCLAIGALLAVLYLMFFVLPYDV
jgi:hypothetical protein